LESFAIDPPRRPPRATKIICSSHGVTKRNGSQDGRPQRTSVAGCPGLRLSVASITRCMARTPAACKFFGFKPKKTFPSNPRRDLSTAALAPRPRRLQSQDVRAPPSRDCRRSDQFARALIGGFWDRLSRYPSAPTPTIEFGQASASSRDEALSGVDLTKAIGPTIGASSRFVKFEMGSILKLNSALREIDQQAYKIC
jgi:hypothetical protein